MDEFGSLAGVLAAAPERQIGILRSGTAVQLLGATQAAFLHVLEARVRAGPLLSSLEQLVSYLHLGMAHRPAEQFRVLYLDVGNHLLRDETIATGSISEAPIYPREIMRRAMEIGSTALILVHNHPSGDPSPSKGDITATRQIAEAGRHLEVVIHDHLIVARRGWTSFRQLGLL